MYRPETDDGGKSASEFAPRRPNRRRQPGPVFPTGAKPPYRRTVNSVKKGSEMSVPAPTPARRDDTRGVHALREFGDAR